MCLIKIVTTENVNYVAFSNEIPHMIHALKNPYLVVCLLSN